MLIDLILACIDASNLAPQYIPQVDFKDLANLRPEDVEKLKTRGCVVIRNIVDDDEAISWRNDLQTLVKANPGVEGLFVFSACSHSWSSHMCIYFGIQDSPKKTNNFSSSSTLLQLLTLFFDYNRQLVGLNLKSEADPIPMFSTS